MIFEIEAANKEDARQTFTYDNTTNTLKSATHTYEFTDNEGKFPEADMMEYTISIPFGKDTPLHKSKNVRLLKIQLGLSCNYTCGYCSQKFVERPAENSQRDVKDFMEKLENLEFEEFNGLKIEFWGGEPFVYWKTLRPLVSALRDKFYNWNKKPLLSIITNGSLLSEEICDWISTNDIMIGLSHDGPGQPVRGPDPFEDLALKARVLALYKERNGKMSFNVMLNRQNISRKAIYDWFVEFTGDPNVQLGEGSLVDAYDADGLAASLSSKKEHFEFRRTAFNDIRVNDGKLGFNSYVQKIDDFTTSVLTHVKSETVGQKCGMDKTDVIAVDLKGNVLTCQNVSAVQTGPNGESHLGGSITDLSAVQIKTATHWKNRPDCKNCPVLHICKGSCMFLDDSELWTASCDNAYSDAIVVFALSLERMTGYFPIYIRNETLPKERRDIFGILPGAADEVLKRKLFPIKVVAKAIELNGTTVFTKSTEEIL